MSLNYLDFEAPIAELDERIEVLRHSTRSETGKSILSEVKSLEARRDALIEQVFCKLSPWQITQLARHPNRPHTLDYIGRIFTEFEELHGDRMFADDPAIVGGLARLDDKPVLVIGHQKGRSTKEKIKRNFGMPRPEGYRKALRLARMAEKFRVPLITFIDTPGAYPGIDAEKRGQSEAIARNLYVFPSLKTPVLSVVIGEGGSGGALAIGVGDYLGMLENSIYSVISPEGCASILWKSAERAADAAEAMGITAHRLHELGLIEEVVSEPKGGAQRDSDQAADNIKSVLCKRLNLLGATSIDKLLEKRQARLMSFGYFNSASAPSL